MNDIDRILMRIKELQGLKETLESTYEDGSKLRGRAYTKNLLSINGKIQQQLHRLKDLGKLGNVWVVVLTIINPKEHITKFAYFTNVTKDVIYKLCEIHFPGWSVLSITQLPLGQLMG